MGRKKTTRQTLIEWQLRQMTLPRFQMFMLLMLTGFSGFFASFAMLYLGISEMWVRYPLAILFAYTAFLLLLRLWLAFHRSSGDSDLGANVDLPEGVFRGKSAAADFSFGGGGDFAGGGAGGGWEAADNQVGAAFSSSSGGGSSVLDGVSIDLDAEEIGLIILAIVAVIGGLLAALYVIYIAPVLLAEILVDGLLLGGLHKRIKHIEQKYWLKTVVRQTLLPAMLCALFFGIAGAFLQTAAPDANSVGEVWREINRPK